MTDGTEHDDDGQYDYGPLQTYQITWRSGHVETVQAHTVMFESNRVSIFGPQPTAEPQFRIYGMFPGRKWRLVLSAPESELHTIRHLAEDEAVAS